MRDFGLVHNDSDPDRYWRLVSYELDRGDGSYANGAGAGLGTMRVVPVVREYRWLDVSNPKALTYQGPVWRLSVVRVTEPGRMPAPGVFSGAAESEAIRRARIRHIRRAIHVDPDRGAAEPAWVEARSAAQGR